MKRHHMGSRGERDYEDSREQRECKNLIDERVGKKSNRKRICNSLDDANEMRIPNEFLLEKNCLEYLERRPNDREDMPERKDDEDEEAKETTKGNTLELDIREQSEQRKTGRNEEKKEKRGGGGNNIWKVREANDEKETENENQEEEREGVMEEIEKDLCKENPKEIESVFKNRENLYSHREDEILRRILETDKRRAERKRLSSLRIKSEMRNDMSKAQKRMKKALEAINRLHKEDREKREKREKNGTYIEERDGSERKGIKYWEFRDGLIPENKIEENVWCYLRPNVRKQHQQFSSSLSSIFVSETPLPFSKMGRGGKERIHRKTRGGKKFDIERVEEEEEVGERNREKDGDRIETEIFDSEIEIKKMIAPSFGSEPEESEVDRGRRVGRRKRKKGGGIRYKEERSWLKGLRKEDFLPFKYQNQKRYHYHTKLSRRVVRTLFGLNRTFKVGGRRRDTRRDKNAN